MRFNSEDIWHDVPAVKITDSLSLPPGVFRVSLSDFAYVWKGFPSMNYLDKCNRLKRTFNTDYFESPTVLTDALSLEKLMNTGYYDPSVGDGSGFIYIYTFEDNVLAGKHKQGRLWWAVDRYDTKLKVGRTEQNILNRVDQQLGLRTAVSEPPILLTALWTKQVALCERTIHQHLSSKRLTDSTGRAAKGGVEWFKDIPTSVIPIILSWVSRYRRGAEVISSTDNFLIA
jgi:hypothetical protein